MHRAREGFRCRELLRMGSDALNKLAMFVEHLSLYHQDLARSFAQSLLN